MKHLLFFVVVVLLTGCGTSFTEFRGSAKLKGGPSDCEAKCREWGMELAGMVALGEYTEGCICAKRGSQLSLHGVGEAVVLSSAGSGGGAVAVKEREAEATAAALEVISFP